MYIKPARVATVRLLAWYLRSEHLERMYCVEQRKKAQWCASADAAPSQTSVFTEFERYICWYGTTDFQRFKTDAIIQLRRRKAGIRVEMLGLESWWESNGPGYAQLGAQLLALTTRLDSDSESAIAPIMTPPSSPALPYATNTVPLPLLIIWMVAIITIKAIKLCYLLLLRDTFVRVPHASSHVPIGGLAFVLWFFQ